MASINCITISGDDPLVLEAWVQQLASLRDVADRSIAIYREELDRAIGSLSPF